MYSLQTPPEIFVRGAARRWGTLATDGNTLRTFTSLRRISIILPTHVRQGIWHGQVVTTETDESDNSVPMMQAMTKLQAHIIS